MYTSLLYMIHVLILVHDLGSRYQILHLETAGCHSPAVSFTSCLSLADSVSFTSCASCGNVLLLLIVSIVSLLAVDELESFRFLVDLFGVLTNTLPSSIVLMSLSFRVSYSSKRSASSFSSLLCSFIKTLQRS